jgi:hypothetical protein
MGQAPCNDCKLIGFGGARHRFISGTGRVLAEGGSLSTKSRLPKRPLRLLDGDGVIRRWYGRSIPPKESQSSLLF